MVEVTISISSSVDCFRRLTWLSTALIYRPGIRCLSSSICLPQKQANPRSGSPSIGLAANQLLIHVPRVPQHLRRGEGIGGGPTGRMSWLRRCVSALFDEERIELPWPIAIETRQYAERLIQEAVRTELATTDLSKLQNLEELFQPPWNEYPEIVSLLELSAFWLQKPELVTKLLKKDSK
ncbi:hypothetical protein ACTXT7_009395 [Hymenolepis weldensis]